MLHLILLIGHLLISYSKEQDQPMADWHLEKDQAGIRVYSRHLSGHRLKELRVQCSFSGTLSTLVAMLSDIEQYPRFMYKTKTARLLHRLSDSDIYYYIETELPWPVANRDMNVHLRFNQDPRTHRLLIKVDKSTDEVAPQPHLVRVKSWSAVWDVLPVTKNQLQITYQCQLDPGGTLPNWLVNLTAATGPYESFKLLRETMQTTAYQSRNFPFLTD